MSENPDVEAAVRSLFKVKDSYSMGDGSTEYSVEYDAGTRAAFKELLKRLTPLDFTPHLSGNSENASLTVLKNTTPPPGPTRTPVFLSLLSVVAIIATGWGVGIIYSSAEGGSTLLIGASFVLCVTAVLIAKEAAQRLVTRRKGRVMTIPYYLPNIPFFVTLPVLYFLPTFGSITFLRSPTIDRDSLFDIYFAGAAACVVAALAVALVGSPDAVTYVPNQAGTLSNNLSILQTLVLSLGAPSAGPSIPSNYVGLLSPVEVAAWIGFLFAFFSLVPAALFDGGRMAKLVLGERGSRLTTMATAFLLVAIDVPNYWVMFLLIFLLAAIQPSNETLDSVSDSRSRKLLFLVAMLLAVVCIPYPQTFLAFPV